MFGFKRGVWNGVATCIGKLFKRKFHYDLSPVKPGQLTLRSTGNVKIYPAPFTANHASCKAGVEVSSTSAKPSSLEFLNSQLDVSVKENDSHNELIVDIPDDVFRSQGEVHVNIAVPHHYSVRVIGTGSGALQLSNLECESANITLEDGHCEFVNMKALNTDIQGKNVNVGFTKPFTGNLTASIESGIVKADKIQGQRIYIETMKGNIEISALYAATSCLRCYLGDIEIDNCHGEAVIENKDGNVTIRSFHGSLNSAITNGNMSVHLSSFTDADISSSQGHINVTVPENLSSHVHIETENLDVGDSLILDIKSRDFKSTSIQGTIGEADESSGTSLPKLSVKSRSVSLGVMDWITAQRLKFSADLSDASS